MFKALTQMKLQEEDTALRGSSCRKLWSLSEAREDSFASRRSAAVEQLCCLVKDLQVMCSCVSSGKMRETTQFFSKTLLFQEAKLPTAEESVPVKLERRNSFDSKG